MGRCCMHCPSVKGRGAQIYPVQHNSSAPPYRDRYFSWEKSEYGVESPEDEESTKHSHSTHISRPAGTAEEVLVDPPMITQVPYEIMSTILDHVFLMIYLDRCTWKSIYEERRDTILTGFQEVGDGYGGWTTKAISEVDLSRMGHLAAETIFKRLWKMIKGLRGSCRILSRMGLEYLTTQICKYSNELPLYRTIKYDLSVEGLAQLKAIILNPKLARNIDEIQLYSFEPHPDLADEDSFIENLRTTLEKNNDFCKGSYFERDCALTAHWLEAREYFFEQLHIQQNGHDIEILKAATPLLTSLKTIEFSCHHSRTRSLFGKSSFYPDLRETVHRKPISARLLGQPIHYGGLGALAQILQYHEGIQNLTLLGIDVRVAQLKASQFTALYNIIRRVRHLQIECSPERPKLLNHRHFSHYLRESQRLLKGALALQELQLGFDVKSIKHIVGGQLSVEKYEYQSASSSKLLHSIIEDASFPNLKKFHLTWCYVTGKELLSFIQRHENTLEDLATWATTILQTIERKDMQRIGEDELNGLVGYVCDLPKIKDVCLNQNSDDIGSDHDKWVSISPFNYTVLSLGSTEGLHPERSPGYTRTLRRDGARVRRWFIDL